MKNKKQNQCVILKFFLKHLEVVHQLINFAEGLI